MGGVAADEGADFNEEEMAEIYQEVYQEMFGGEEEQEVAEQEAEVEESELYFERPLSPSVAPPEIMTPAQQKKIEELMLEGYLEGSTLVTKQHKNIDVWSTFVAHPETKVAICKRCFKVFTTDPRSKLGLKSCMTRHARSWCETREVQPPPNAKTDAMSRYNTVRRGTRK